MADNEDRSLLERVASHESVRRDGFTLLELLTAIVIIAILVAMLLPAAEMVREKMEGVNCRNNLRNLHVAFGNYVTDKGCWPQVPPDIAAQARAGEEKAYGEWWISQTTPYGGPEAVWKCPSYLREIATMDEEQKKNVGVIHYTPTEFDAQRMTPYKWSGQPWLIEIGNFHGPGNFILYPDGSIRTLDQLGLK